MVSGFTRFAQRRRSERSRTQEQSQGATTQTDLSYLEERLTRFEAAWVRDNANSGRPLSTHTAVRPTASSSTTGTATTQ